MNRNASFSFNLEEWEKKPRKPFNIKKTWSRNKPAVEETSGVTVENFNDDNISFVTSTVHLRSPSPPKDLTTDESHQQSSRNSIAKSSNSSTKKKTPESRELRGVLENMPSLRKSTLPARRHDESQQASSSKPPPKATKNKKKSDFAEKPIQKLSMQNQQHSGAKGDKVLTGRKRSLSVPSSSSSKEPTKRAKRLTPIEEEEESQPVTVSDQMVDLWMCSKHVQRRKSDLCEIDIVMSSLRDIGHEMFEESDDEVEQKVIRQVVKKTLESLWKLVKESAVNKNNESELKKVTKELSTARAELLAKGKERNQELMKLSELQEQAKELAEYEQASSSEDVRAKFDILKQNIPTIPE